MLCSGFLSIPSLLLPRLIIPLQALGVYYVMISGLIELVRLRQLQHAERVETPIDERLS
jgi:hypothetical protein